LTVNIIILSGWLLVNDGVSQDIQFHVGGTALFAM